MIRLRSITILAGLLALAGCKKTNQYAAPPPPKVTVTLPVSRPVIRYLEATGTVTAIASVDLVARVQGFLQDISYTDGAVVKAGDVLFTVEPLPYQARLQQAQAAEAGAKAQLTNAESTFARQQELQNRQVSSVQALDEALAQRDNARAAVLQAEANTQLAAINYTYTRVQAPFDGRVTAHQASVGQLVGTTPTPLATLVQVRPIQVTFSVSEQDVQRLRADGAKRGERGPNVPTIKLELGLQSETGTPHRGQLDYISPVVDPTTGTMTARGVLENEELTLVPGYFARVRVPVGEPTTALLIPDAALNAGQSGRYVLVVGDDNVVALRPVTAGGLQDGLRVIESGLKPDDKVIVSGLQRASPGQKVEAALSDAKR